MYYLFISTAPPNYSLISPLPLTPNQPDHIEIASKSLLKEDEIFCKTFTISALFIIQTLKK
jgi:hypothetical protein